MSPRPQRLSERAACRFVAITIAACGAVTGSESPIPAAMRVDAGVDGRVGGSVPPRLDPLAGLVADGEWKLGVILEAAYEDNIFLSATDPESDGVIRLSPSIAYRKGDADSGEGAHVRFAYRPTAVFYFRNTDDNRLDHEARWEAGWRGKAVSLAYSGNLRRLGDATADTGAPTDRRELENVVRFAWAPREKILWEIAAGQSSTSYDRSGLYDSKQFFGEAALRYAYSPKTRVGIAYRGGRFEVDGAGDQDFHRLTGRIEWMPREKIAVDLEAGAEYRSFDTGSDTSPFVLARVAWLPREGTGVYLTGYRREEASAFYAGQNYSLGGLGVGVSQRLGGKWTGRLDAGWERASYSRVSGAGASGRVDKIHFLRPSLEYRFTDHFQMGVFYRYARSRSNQPGFGYESHSTGVQLGYEF